MNERSEPEASSEQERYWVSIGWTASDSRPSAITVGTVGSILLMVAPFLLIFLLDLPILHEHLRLGLRRDTGKPKQKTKKSRKRRIKPDSDLSA